MDLFGLRERRALVVGGGFGMGRRSALLLANVGAHVAIVDRDSERAQNVAREIVALGRRGVATAADVTSEADAQRAVAEASGGLGGLDVLVNVVGLSQSASLLDLPAEQLDAAFAHNFRQHLYVATAFARAFDAERGAIVMVNSTAGVRAALNRAAYGASKAALASLTVTMALEWGPRGIRVNGVAPGITRTDRSAHSAENETRLSVNIPLRRIGDQMDVAKTILFLASDLASYVTGQTLVVDGGALPRA
jgi:NAD(P)-dependent dehydrogenase (short-subunit alcohol dehydrogenase family)